MGCWNKTCGISNLHIYAGSPVYVIVLQQQSYNERCYSTAFWRPVMLPFLSEYNDYGGGRYSHSNINYIIDGLKKHLVPMEQGPNQYHDIEVKAETLNEELFFDAVHEQRLKVNLKMLNKESAVDFVMLRKDIVDDILDNWEQHLYVGTGKGNTGYENSYILYKFQDIINGVKPFIKRLAEVANGDPSSSRETRCLKYMFMELHELYEQEEHNLVASYLRSISNYSFSQIVHPQELIVTAVEQGDLTKAEELLADVLLAAYINRFMESSRKNWAPGGHEGSQSDDPTPYRVLCNAITHALDRESSEDDY